MFFSYTQYAISVRTGGLLPINVCRTAKSIKNDIHQWKELCIEGKFIFIIFFKHLYTPNIFHKIGVEIYYT